jgi:hypothetical protein
VLSPAAFRYPFCARDSIFSHFRDLLFLDLHLYAGQKDGLDNALLSLLPSAIAELNILSSLKITLSQPSTAGKDIFAASVTGMNGVSIVVNHVIDAFMKSSALRDNTQTDWFVDAALFPGILHISVDSESDTNDHFFLVSIGVVAQPQGQRQRPCSCGASEGTVVMVQLLSIFHLGSCKARFSSHLHV